MYVYMYTYIYIYIHEQVKLWDQRVLFEDPPSHLPAPCPPGA